MTEIGDGFGDFSIPNFQRPKFGGGSQHSSSQPYRSHKSYGSQKTYGYGSTSGSGRSYDRRVDKKKGLGGSRKAYFCQAVRVSARVLGIRHPARRRGNTPRATPSV